MHYEHCIRMDEFETLGLVLTHAQLWAALVLRAQEPGEFMPALESYRIRERTVDAGGLVTLKRSLDFGGFVVHDRATLVAPDVLIMDTEAGPTWPASRLTLRIEAPAAGLLLRFVYESAEEVGSELDALTDQLRRQAYEAADRDMVARIHQLAAAGALT